MSEPDTSELDAAFEEWWADYEESFWSGLRKHLDRIGSMRWSSG